MSDEEEHSVHGQVKSEARAAFVETLEAAALPEPLAAALRGGLSFPECDVVHDGCGVRRLTLVAQLRAGGPGAQLRLFYHKRVRYYDIEFELDLRWRSLPAPPPPRQGGGRELEGWTPLASAWLQSSPPTGNAEVDERCTAQFEVHDTRGLTPAAVAALRAAVLGAGADAPDSATLPDWTLLQLALRACGTLDALDGVEEGHVWYPDEDLCEAPINAEPTSWLEHAARVATRAATLADAYYAGVDVAQVKLDWGDNVLAWRETHEDNDEDEEDEEEDEWPPVEKMWDYAQEHGGLPWRRRSGMW